MSKSALMVPLLAAMAFAGTAHAACPQLPASTGLTWEARSTGDTDFCRALRGDGSEAFGLYIAPEAPFELKRSNREEAAQIDGHEVSWYRAELATQPDVEARETLVELPDGRIAHIWLQARGDAQLGELFALTQRLDFDPPPAPMPEPATQIASSDPVAQGPAAQTDDVAAE